MIKKLFYITFLFSVILTGNNIANAQDYSICATNADGAILVDERDSDNTSFALASSPTSFTHANSEDSQRGGYCEITPDNYKIKMFKMGLCTENPFIEPDAGAGNTIGADLSSCVNVFDKVAGKEVNIQPDGEVGLLDGETLILPIGTYTHIYALLSNVIQIKHIQEYAVADGAGNFNIRGYNPLDNGVNGIGKFCYTGLNNDGNKFVFTPAQERLFPGFTTLRGYTLPTQFTGKQSTAGFLCGAESAAISGNDWAISIINSFGNRMAINQDVDGAPTSRVASNFRNAIQQDRGFHDDFPTIIQYYYLYNSADTPAISAVTAEKILFIQNDSASNVTISENTTSFKLSFKTNNAVEMAIYEESDAKGNSADRILQATAVNANTIFLKVETKTKRSRGAWR
jgi:hypothetical protein